MFKKFYLNSLFFHILIGIGLGYVLSFFFPMLMWAVHAVLGLFLIVFLVDYLLIFKSKKGIEALRILPEKLSNGDENKIRIAIKNQYPFRVNVRVIDEIPFQFQKRDFEVKKLISSEETWSFEYFLEPKERGIYEFGKLYVFTQSPIGLVSKRFEFCDEGALPCYPSFIHLKKYELMALQNEFLWGGMKKIRKLGHTMEFEQIKDYVQGDDLRTINWKATSKVNKLMVNQYQDEKSQRIFLLIDKGRAMQMPFNGLTLLDYSINAVMALSHIILKKSDKVGMMTFAKKVENKIPAENKPHQLKKISEGLFHINTNFYESDFGRLYQDLKITITQRSLVLLFTNFETLDALNRQMKYLRGIAKNHVLVVILFKNAELQNLMNTHPEHIQEVYDQIIAEKLEFEKKLIIQELRKYGIYTLYTLPENLTIEAINKYLEMKSRGII